ncbi:MAG: serine/threonine protein kinase [Phycisphaeraceae bacterium]|nr:serine/threonine protein kinase [Phycisphaeraceae bacterium]MBX3367944.1 serine/threonine protein kinase [Phycisphaeraceae bacterium]
MNVREFHQRVSDEFVRIRALTREARPGELDMLAQENKALADEVRSLLAYDDTSHACGTDAPTVDPADSETVGSSHGGSPRPAGLPENIGPYRILDRIGSGGSGLVLLAEQHEPVRRRVAIKIVPHAAISQELAARFEFERRALEKTDHPNIARILDAGRTAEGLPYLVMDYVEGVAITEHCRRHALDLRERIDLMLAVADAVQHAHQRGVIHRDLKPANILVARSGGRDTPRVLDFGIAKPIPELFGESTPQTLGLPIGTPAYMAPEQASGGPIDTRADVYALGAVLYELACGRPPVPTGGAMLDVLRRIRDEVPEPVSRVRARDQDRFGSDHPPRWLLDDLDCVLARSLEKSAERRYATVSDFAQDLSRILRSEPIEARPPTIRYRAVSFARRRKGLVLSLGVACAAITLGFLGLWLGFLEADRQRTEAVRQTEALAEVNRFLNDDILAQASPFKEGASITVLESLDKAASKIDQRLGSRPDIAAAIHATLGMSYSELDALDKARVHLERSLELSAAIPNHDRKNLLRSRIVIASLACKAQDFRRCRADLEELLPIAERELGPDDPWLYRMLNDLGVAYESLDMGRESVAALTRSLEGRKRLLGETDDYVLVTAANLALAYDRVGDTERSLAMLIEALDIAEALPSVAPIIPLGLSNNIGATLLDLRRESEAVVYLRRAERLATIHLPAESHGVLSIRGNLAGLENKLGNHDRALELYRTTFDAQQRVLGADTLDTHSSRYGIANSLYLSGQLEAAVAAHAALLPDSIRVHGDTHWFTAQVRQSLALALKDAGRPEEALPHARLASEHLTLHYGPDHERTRVAVNLYLDLSGRPPE